MDEDSEIQEENSLLEYQEVENYSKYNFFEDEFNAAEVEENILHAPISIRNEIKDAHIVNENISFPSPPALNLYEDKDIYDNEEYDHHFENADDHLYNDESIAKTNQGNISDSRNLIMNIKSKAMKKKTNLDVNDTSNNPTSINQSSASNDIVEPTDPTKSTEESSRGRSNQKSNRQKTLIKDNVMLCNVHINMHA